MGGTRASTIDLRMGEPVDSAVRTLEDVLTRGTPLQRFISPITRPTDCEQTKRCFLTESSMTGGHTV
jgi:hypothetical protein